MRRIIILICLCLPVVSFATPQVIYPFATVNESDRFNELTQTLRCLVCQNQNLADSNAPLAVQLREIVYQQIQAGHSDEEIIRYLRARYGDFVLFNPPLQNNTLVLWLAPFMMVLVALASLLIILRRRRSAAQSPSHDLEQI